MSLTSDSSQQGDDEEAYILWEKDNIISDELKDEMETMWEIPQICHFFHEAKEALNLPPISVYEVERMLLIPKASKQLAGIMTCLLCSPSMKSKLKKIPSMPYKFWTHTLIQKCRNWFKVYQNKHQDAIKVLEAIGIEPTFWKIFPDIACIENTDFDKLTLKQKVWLLKSVCDTLMVSLNIKKKHNRKTIQDEIVKHSDEDQDEMILGTDRHGNTYFYLNQYLDSDLRVYRHNMINKVISVVKFPVTNPDENEVFEPKSAINIANYLSHEESSNSFDVSMTSSPKPESEKTKIAKSTKLERPRRKKSGWKNGILPNKKKYRLRRLAQASLSSHNGCLTDESRCSSGASFYNDATPETQSNHDFDSLKRDDETAIHEVMDFLVSKIEDDLKTSQNKVVENKLKKEVEEEDSPIKELDNSIASLLKNSECSLISKKKIKCLEDDVTEKIQLLSGITLSKVSTSKSKKSEKSSLDVTLKSEYSITPVNKVDFNKDSRNLKNFNGVERKDFWNVTDSFFRCNFGCEKFHNNEKLYDGYFSSVDVKKNNEYWEKNEGNVKVESLLEDIDSSTFDLVADSVEGLRDFIAIFALEHSMASFKKEDKYKIACEHKLIKKLCTLAENLEDKEEALKEATINARHKLCKELTNFRNGIKEESNWMGENNIMFNWWIVGAQSFNFSQLPDLNNCIEKIETKVRDENDTSRDSSSPTADKNKMNDDKKENEEGDESTEEEQQSTRVLRTRGVSSYTGHFYSDDDSDDHDLPDRWSDVNLNLQNSSSQSLNLNDSSQNRRSESESADSDQEWLLPRNRRKKKKRQSASRRFKSFQHKIQVIPVNNILDGNSHNESIDHSQSVDPLQVTGEMIRRNSRDEVDVKPDISKIKLNPSINDTKPSKNELEKMDSIHSELDIPEEKPFIDPLSGAIQNPSVSLPALPRRSNIPVVSSNIQLQPMQFATQYRGQLRQQLMARPLMPNTYQYRTQSMIHRPRMSYRNTVPTLDPRLMQARGPQMPQPQLPGQMTSGPRQPYAPEMRPGMRIAQRMPQTRALRPRLVMPPGSRMRAPLTASVRAPYNVRTPQAPQVARRAPRPVAPPAQKGTSLIVLSDSDDEIEMIVIEKSTEAKNTASASKPVTTQARIAQKPVVTSQATVDSAKSILPTQMIRRMNQGGISITPLKQTQAAQNKAAEPKLVVVVNETGSHYALALPNGSKLILTPEQVAQIRASNGGNLAV